MAVKIIKHFLTILILFILLIFTFNASAENSNLSATRDQIDLVWQCLNQTFNKPDHINQVKSNDDIGKKLKECLEPSGRNGKSLESIDRFLKTLFEIKSEREIVFSWDFLIRNNGSIELLVKAMKEDEKKKESGESENSEDIDEYYFYY